jgi:VWFA-related protein
MRKWGIVAVITTVFISIAFAIEEEQGNAPVFRSGTNFVQVPVIVQKSGKHLSGLKKEDFLLREDNKDQPIASFEEIHAAKSGQNVNVQAQFGNRAGESPSQITMIALDMVNTPSLDRTYFTQEFEKYLAKAGTLASPIGLVAIERNGIQVLQDFTKDSQSLLSAIGKNATAQPTAHNEVTQTTRQISDQMITEVQTQFGNVPDLKAMGHALQFRQADEAMTRFQDRSSRLDVQFAIQQLAQSLKGLPGRKSLLLVGSGFKFIDSNIVLKSISGGDGGRDQVYSAENVGETLNQAAYTWKMLNDANVAVYPIDTRRTVNTAFQAMDTSGSNAPTDLSLDQSRQANRDVLDTFKTISAATGGKPCFNRTDLDNCIREAVDDDDDYYLLGFYADKSNSRPGWHKIEVKLGEKANLRYRQGFIMAKFNPEAARKTDISLALSSPVDYTELPFTGKFDSFADQGSKKLAKFRLQIPPQAIMVDEPSGHLDFDVVAIARAQGGKEAARFIQRIDRKFPPENIAEIKRVGIDYGNQLALAPGEYGVWFVVRDNLSGRTGSAVVPLKVP